MAGLFSAEIETELALFDWSDISDAAMSKMLFAWYKALITWYAAALKSIGYPVIILMMAAESSILPLPSEVVIPPAAHWANTGQIPLSIAGIIVAGTIGSWLGASAMYWTSRLAGRPLVLRYGRYALITPEKLLGAERWATRFGSPGIFISRLLPVVRHLIGVPAGIVRMNYKLFSLYTLLGSGIWCGVLCWVGVKAGQDEQLMRGELHRISLWVGGALTVLCAIYYFFVHRHMRK